MPKTLEGFVDDGRAAPLPGISAVVTVVGDGTVVASGVSGPDGHWQFDGLPDAAEYFVNLVDGAGNAIVRGPWSGELREAWVRDRLALPDTAHAVLPNGGNTTVGGLPLVLDPDPLNVLEWRAGGIFSAGAVGLTQAAADLLYEPIDTAYTKAEADARYVDVAGDTMTGTLVIDSFPGESALYLGNAATAGGPQIIFRSSGVLSPYDVRLMATGGSGGAAQGTLAIGAASTVLSGALTVASKPVALSPDSGNTLEWRANGFWTAGGLTQTAADARYLQLTGGNLSGTLVMNANILPAPHITRDLGSNLSYWQALWVNNITAVGTVAFTTAPTVGGAALLTATAADALFLTPAEGNAAYATTAHAHAAAYVDVGGDTMTGGLIVTGAGPGTVSALQVSITGQTVPPLNIQKSGTIEWSSGVAAADAFLTRTGTATLAFTAHLIPEATNVRDLGFTATRWRTLYGMTADLTTSLTVASKPLVISPDAANIIEWRANGFYAAAGAVSDIWVNTTGDTMTGALNMTADILPTVTNVRSLGSTSLRWLKIWATDADFTNAPTVGGSALLTQTTADALFLTPAEGNAAYVDVVGDTMTGALVLQGAAATTNVLQGKIAADTQPRFRADANGLLEWGPGGSTAPDTTLARAGANDIRINAGFHPTTSGTRELGQSGLRWNKLYMGNLIDFGALAGTYMILNTAGDAQFFRTTGGGGANNDAIWWRANKQVFRVYDYTASAELFVVDQGSNGAGGTVWINKKTDPALPAGYTATPGLLVQHEGAAQYNMLSLARASSDALSQTFNFWRARGTWASKVAIANGDAMGLIQNWGWSGSQWLTTSYIRGDVSGTVTTTAVPGALVFGTADSAGTLAARLSIGPSGLIGVGGKADGTAAAQLDLQASAVGNYTMTVRPHASHSATLPFARFVNAAESWVVLGVNNSGWVSDAISASAIGTYATKRIPVYSSGGTLHGYIPIYT